MSDSASDISKYVVKDMRKLTRALNRHLDEEKCQHSITDLASEVFDNE